MVMVASEKVLKQYLTAKQNSYLESGCLQEVVAMERLTVCYNVIL